MIKFNEKFSFEKDKYCWQLHEFYMGKGKDKKPKMQKNTTYHATLEQVCGVIIDRSCGDCESLEEIKALLQNATETLKLADA
ncbi:MAG: hypothetical protein GY750_21170 [Lentisphaerae bacterium]|nr:hypothetical protein [Lentisphaerota bacterium]